MKITVKRAPGNVSPGPFAAGRAARERIQGRWIRSPAKAGPPAVIPAKAGIQWFKQDLPACLQAGMTIKDKATLRKRPRNGLSPK